ncbi:MAG TPA: DUF2298 domain-containing protein [Anaerolineae bacterium]|nr:DUF2298 domain-containing protein [Anaerolineae bacterium]
MTDSQQTDVPQLNNQSPTWHKTIIPILLTLTLILAAYLRFTGLNWDDSHHLHPDERFLTIIASQLEIVTNPLDYLQTSTSPLNPHNKGHNFYVYGNFPMTVSRYIAEVVQSFCQTEDAQGIITQRDICAYNFKSYNGVHILGRFLSGLVDLISLIFTFLIANHLYNKKVALLATFMLATAVMPIQQSHFFTMDNWAAACTTITMYAAVRAAGIGAAPHERYHKRWWIIFGLFLGLTVSARINIAPLALMAVVAAFIWTQTQNQLDAQQGLPRPWYHYFPYAQTVVFIAAITSMLVFRLGQPYAFNDQDLRHFVLGLAADPRTADPALDALDPPSFGQVIFASSALLDAKIDQANFEHPEPGFINRFLNTVSGTVDWATALLFSPQWLANMEEIQRLQQPDAVFPPALQWTDRPAIIFPLTNMILYGMGPLAGIIAWLGFLWALWRIARARPDWTLHLLPVSWVGLYFLFAATRWVKSIRYFLPIYPLLFILAGWFLYTAWQRVNTISAPTRQKMWQTAVASLTAATLLSSLAWALSFVQIYQQPVTRITASQWIYDNIPSSATLLYTDTDGNPQQKHLPARQYQLLPDTTPFTVHFSMPEDGTVTGLRLNYVSDLITDTLSLPPTEHAFQVTLHPIAQFDQTLTSGIARATLDTPRQPVTIPLDNYTLTGGERFTIQTIAGPTSFLALDTSILINEHWDDPLPLRLDGLDGFGQFYAGVAEGVIPITGADSPDKKQSFYRWLDEADYIILSSQRAVWSTPRLPLTFPLTIAYYEGLFNGDLGFDLVAQFHADLNIGPLYISDTGGTYNWGEPPAVGWPPPGPTAAEEAFSVYDHPPVWIFGKTDRYNSDTARAHLDTIDITEVVFTNPGEATQAPNGLMLTNADAQIQQQNGTFAEIFNPTGRLSTNPALAAAVWWLSVILLGWLTFPLTFALLRGLPDRGYAFARIFALLFISYFTWLLASLDIMPHTRTTMLWGLLLLILLNLWAFRRHQQAILDFVRHHGQLLLLMEIIALALYLLQIGIRLGNPDVWDVIWGGEKPMDLSYFTAVMKSTQFPPYDPWFAGGYINYYYYGFVFVGVLAKLWGIVPTVAYNLILPMLFSFTGLSAFSLAYNLVSWRSQAAHIAKPLARRPLIAGFTALTLCILLGNLAQIGVVLHAWERTSDTAIYTGNANLDRLARVIDGGLDLLLTDRPAAIYTGDWFWTATRTLNIEQGEVMPITEFPFFTFLYGDLHAHMISLPLAMLALAWSISLALTPKLTDPSGAGSWLEKALRWGLGGLAIGVLQPTNSWDWPAYLVIGCLAIIYYGYKQNGRSFSLPALGQITLQITALVTLFFLTFYPYTAEFGTAYNSLSLWPGSYTHVSSYLRVHGLFLFLVITHLAREFRLWSRTITPTHLTRWKPFAPAVLLALFAYIPIILYLYYGRSYWIAPIALTLIIISGLLGLQPNLPSHRRITLILISSALGLTLFVEIFVLDGDIGRMNTVFKFYMQTWVLLSVTGGVSFALALPALRRRPQLGRSWRLAFAILIFFAALYPITATSAKWAIRMSDEAPHTLDGMAFMQTTSYHDQGQLIHLSSDYDALQWMQRNIDGSPVIMEGHSPPSNHSPYRSITNRVAMYTGLPAVIGWDWHQRQQRSVLPGTLVYNRIRDVNNFYNTTDITTAQQIIAEYDVRYIYVGQLEWVYYQPAGLLKFDQMRDQGLLIERYRSPEVSIYEVPQS